LHHYEIKKTAALAKNSHTFAIKRESFLYCLDDEYEIMDFISDCKQDGTCIEMLNLPFDLDRVHDEEYIDENAPFVFKLVKGKVELKKLEEEDPEPIRYPRRIRMSKKVKMKTIAIALKKRYTKYKNYYKFCAISYLVYYEKLLLKDIEIFTAFCTISSALIGTSNVNEV
jgi:hypothetical protein